MPKSRYVRLAQNVANQATGPFRHGAVVLSKGKVLAEACNKFSGTENKSIHAEARVINKVPRHLTHQATMIVVRVGASGLLATSKPCPTCQKLITKLKFRHIYFS